MFDVAVDPGKFEDVLDPVAALVDECKMDVDEDGIQINAVDPANVGLIDLTIPASWEGFHRYDAKDTEFAYDLNRMIDILSMGDDRARLELVPDMGKMNVTLGELEYTLGLIDSDEVREANDIPDGLNHTASFTAPRDFLDIGVTAADMVSDRVQFGADGDSEVVYIEAEGDLDQSRYQDGVDDLEVVEKIGDAHSVFSLDYIEDMEGAIPGDSPVGLEIGDEIPMVIEFEVHGADGTYLIAPRVQSD